ncbi:thioesterase family protein [Desulfolucanica intricata]|uniref:thioesterase family protein n=1 Tax=Desulfolucanica intricata TaxID=1285191 RepID=UPI00082FBDAC|nr:thioesterase family protein [Desulfolucanica intricata]
MADLQVGLKGESSITASESNTAVAYGSGGVPVFATPAMVALMENAAMNSVEPYLAPKQTTVGTRIEITHKAATPIGMKVVAKSELLSIEGKKLVFKVEAFDDKELIGTGIHERFIILKEKFLQRVLAKIN